MYCFAKNVFYSLLIRYLLIGVVPSNRHSSEGGNPSPFNLKNEFMLNKTWIPTSAKKMKLYGSPVFDADQQQLQIAKH
jgi:hypothetical protein